MDQLEKEVEKAVAQMMIKEPSTTPPKHPSQVPETAPKAAAASPPPAHTAPVPGSATVTGNLASGLGPDDEGLLPSAIYDTKVDETVRATIGKMDEQQFATAVENAKNHPEFAGYVKGVRLEVGWMRWNGSSGKRSPKKISSGSMCGSTGNLVLEKGWGWRVEVAALGNLSSFSTQAWGAPCRTKPKPPLLRQKELNTPLWLWGALPLFHNRAPCSSTRSPTQHHHQPVPVQL